MGVSDVIFNVNRLFEHPAFQEHKISEGKSSDHLAYEAKVNFLLKEREDIIATIEVDLPKKGFTMTPKSVSIHEPVFPIVTNEVDAEGQDTEEKLFILFVDLYIQPTKPSYSKKKKSKSPKGRARSGSTRNSKKKLLG